MTRTVLTAPHTIYVAAGGNDANPGTLALPKLTVQAAITSAYNDYDWQGIEPHIDISNSQVGPASMSGPLVGHSQIVFNFSAPNLTWLSTDHCLILAEKAIAITTGYPVTWVPDYPTAAGGKSAFYLHNDCTLDVFNGQNIVSGQALGDTVIEADGQAIITVSHGFELQGLLKPAFLARRNSDWTISGQIKLNSCNVKLYDWRSCSTLNINASYASTGSPVLTGSTVSGNSVLNTNGTKTSIPGGIASSTGGQINDSGSI
jgi:hypothetical protein